MTRIECIETTQSRSNARFVSLAALAVLGLMTLRCAPAERMALANAGNAPGTSGRLAVTESAGGDATAAAAMFAPRVSRTFFGKDLSGEVVIQAQARNSARQAAQEPITSRVTWKEYAPTEPAPTGDYLADFRDFQGCAEYAQVNGFQVCFRVQPDVSSVSLSDSDVTLRGVEPLIDRAANDGCGDGQISNVKLQGAQRNAQQMTATYVGQKGACAFSVRVHIAAL